MKQIIPFKKELLFKTKVSEITSISLEHTLSLKNDDLISGEFHITGDYKMTEGSINREAFAFHLPFDIALDSRYDMDSIVIDIDNFYYEIVNNEFLQVNIDVYVEGEKLEEEVTDKVTEIKEGLPEKTIVVEATEKVQEEEELVREKKELEPKKEVIVSEVGDRNMLNQEEILDSSCSSEELKRDDEIFTNNIEYKAPEVVTLETDNHVGNKEFNIFENIDNSDTYVTYHVYIVKENDTVDTILTKYGVTKEEVLLYNDLENIKPGTKLIIPNTHE